MTEINDYTIMADTVEKIYCNDQNSATWALMNNQNNWMNNPFMYLIWLAFFGENGFGKGNNQADNFNSRQIAALQETVNTNHNNDLAMSAIQGNGQALHELAGNLNVGVSALSSAIQGIQASIGQVGSTVGLTGERVINAIGNGDLNIIQQLKDCCCSNKTLIQQMGYEEQLRDQSNTSSVLGRLDQLSNGMTQGFAQVGYATAQQTSQIVNAANSNTQKILDTLNNHWVAETSQALQDAKFEVSQLKQTQYLANQMNGVPNSGSIWG